MPRKRRSSISSKRKKSTKSISFFPGDSLILAIILSFFALFIGSQYIEYKATVAQNTPTIQPFPGDDTGAYICNCSKDCANISTCDEARYQLNTCGCANRDKDGDGTPCENICP